MKPKTNPPALTAAALAAFAQLPAKQNRVKLSSHYVAPATLAKIEALRHHYGSTGRVLDAALAKL